MVSKLTEQLLFLPLTLLKYLCTFAHYDKRTDRWVQSHGFPVVNFWLNLIGNTLTRIILIGLLIESVWAGHVRDINELVVTSYILPLFFLSIAFSVNYLVQYTFTIYVGNQVMHTHKTVGLHFELSRTARDGNEKIVMMTYGASIILTIMSVPFTALTLQLFKGVFYHTRFDTFEENIFLGIVASFGLSLDVQYFTLGSHEWSGQLLTIVHVCFGGMAISYAFNTIFLFRMENAPTGLSIQMACSFLLFTTGFDGLSNAIVRYTEASQEFLESYKNMSEANKHKMKSLKPPHFEIKELFTYDKFTFATIMQDFVLANTIDLLLAFEEM